MNLSKARNAKLEAANFFAVYNPIKDVCLADVVTYILSLLENEIMYVSNKVHCPCMHIIIQPESSVLFDAFIRAYNMLGYDKGFM